MYCQKYLLNVLNYAFFQFSWTEIITICTAQIVFFSKICIFGDYLIKLYIIIVSKYSPEYTKLHYFNIFSGVREPTIFVCKRATPKMALRKE